MAASQQFLTVLFADLAGSTRLYQTEGDVEAHRKVSDSLQSMRSDVERNSGKIIRTVGDAVLASFDKTDDAFRAAVAMQRSHINSPLSLRAGFHCGEVIPDDGDIYGNAVNLAARITAYANATEIFTTQDSVDQLSAPLRAQAYYLDRIDFRGVDKPMPVFRIDWSEATENTEIVTAVSRTMRYRTNKVLDLTVGSRSIRVDPINSVIKLGRSVDNDIIVEHNSTSRNHARVEFLHGRYHFKDTSTNGSYVIRPGRLPEFIRREGTFLEDFGTIGLGWSPVSDNSYKIHFRVTVLK